MILDNNIILIVSLALGGIIAGYLIRILVDGITRKANRHRASAIVDEATKQADNLRKEAEIEAKEFLYQSKAQFEEEAKEQRQDLQRLEKRLQQREENLDRKFESLDKKEQDLTNREKSVAGQQRAVSEKEKECSVLIEQQLSKLETISNMTVEDAKDELKSMIIDEARFDAAKTIKRIEDETKETADKKAREIISFAVQRYAGDYI
jgi:ribonuclease Y